VHLNWVRCCRQHVVWIENDKFLVRLNKKNCRGIECRAKFMRWDDRLDGLQSTSSLPLRNRLCRPETRAVAINFTRRSIPRHFYTTLITPPRCSNFDSGDIVEHASTKTYFLNHTGIAKTSTISSLHEYTSEQIDSFLRALYEFTCFFFNKKIIIKIHI